MFSKTTLVAQVRISVPRRECYEESGYATVLPYDPGERLRVRVTLNPEGY